MSRRKKNEPVFEDDYEEDDSERLRSGTQLISGRQMGRTKITCLDIQRKN